MFRLESYVAPLLVGYLNRYINVKAEDLQLRLWGGDAVLNNLELRHDVLHSCIPIPVTIQSARVLQLRVHVPWTKLQSESITVTVSTVECILRANYDYKSNMQTRAAETTKVQEDVAAKVVEDSQSIPTYFQAYVSRILNNIQLVVHNLIVKFVDSDLALSINVKSLECFSTNSEWQYAFTDVCGPEWVARKALRVTDLTICLDEVNAQAGRIEAFQPPIVYRCNLECRLFFDYFSAACASGQGGKAAATTGRAATLLTLTAAPKLSRVSCTVHSLSVSLTDRQLAGTLKLTQRALELYARDDDSSCSAPSSFLASPSSSAGAGELHTSGIEPNFDEQRSMRKSRAAQQGWLNWALGYVLPSDDSGNGLGSDGLAREAPEQDESALFELEMLIRQIQLALKVACDSQSSAGRETPAETDTEEPLQSGSVTPRIASRAAPATLSTSSSSSSLAFAQNVRGIEQRVAVLHSEMSRNGPTLARAQSQMYLRNSNSSGSRVIGATYPIEAIGVSLVDEMSEQASESASSVGVAQVAAAPRVKYSGLRYRSVALLKAGCCQMTTRLHLGASESAEAGPGRKRNRLMSLGVGGLPPARLAGRGGIIVTRVGLESGYEFDLSLDDVQLCTDVSAPSSTPDVVQRSRQMVLGCGAVYLHRSCDQNDSVTLGVSLDNCTLKLLGGEPEHLMTPFAVSYKEKRSAFVIPLPLHMQSACSVARGRRDYCSLRCDPIHVYCSTSAMPSLLVCLNMVTDLSDSVRRAFSSYSASTIPNFPGLLVPPTFTRVVNFEDDLRLGMFEWRTEPVLDGPLHHDVHLIEKPAENDAGQDSDTAASSSSNATDAEAELQRVTRSDEVSKLQSEAKAQAEAEGRDGGVSRIDWDRVFPASVVCFEVCRDEAAMYWRYAQPRALVRIRMSPIPFAFAHESEADRAVTTSVVVCKLQHFDSSENRFVDSLCFTLSDGEPFDTGPLDVAPKNRRNTPDEEERVEALLWRILMRTDDAGAVTALAAAARIDSLVVCSEALCMDARVPQISFNWCDSLVPCSNERAVTSLEPFNFVDSASALLHSHDTALSESLIRLAISDVRVRAYSHAVTRVNGSAALRLHVLDMCSLYQRCVLDQLNVSVDVTARKHPPSLSDPTSRANFELTCDTTVHSVNIVLEQSSVATLLHCVDRIRFALGENNSHLIAEGDSPALAQSLIVCNDTCETIEVETLGATVAQSGASGNVYRLSSGQATLIFPVFAAERSRTRLAFRIPSISATGRTAPVCVQRGLRSDTEISHFQTLLVSDSDGLPIPLHVMVRQVSANATSQAPVCQVVLRGSLQLVSLLDLDVQAHLRFAPLALANDASRRNGRSCTIRPELLDLLLQPIAVPRGRHAMSLLLSPSQVQSVQFRADSDASWSRVVQFAGQQQHDSDAMQVSHSLLHLHVSQGDPLAVWCSVVHGAWGHVLVLSPLFLLHNQLPHDLLASLSVHRSVNQSHVSDSTPDADAQFALTPSACSSFARLVTASLFPSGCDLEPPAGTPPPTTNATTTPLLLGLRVGVRDTRLSRPPLILNTRPLFCKFLAHTRVTNGLFALLYKQARAEQELDVPRAPITLSFDADCEEHERQLQCAASRAFELTPTVRIAVFADNKQTLLPDNAATSSTAIVPSDDFQSRRSWSQFLQFVSMPSRADGEIQFSDNGELASQSLHLHVLIRHCEVIVCDPHATASNLVDAVPFLGVRLGQLEAETRVGSTVQGDNVTKLFCRLKALEVANLLYHYQDRQDAVYHYPAVLSLNARQADDADLTVSCELERVDRRHALRKVALSCPAMLEVFLEDTFVQRLVNVAPAFFNVLARPSDEPPPPPSATADADSLKELQVDALTLCLTVKCNPPTVPLCISLSRSLIRLEPLNVKRSNSATTANDSVIQEAVRHYLRNALFKSGRVLGSLELLGNPTGFFSEMSAGVADLVRMPAAQAQRYGKRYALTGLYNGFESLGTHLLRGSLNTVRALASSVAQNLDRLSCDSEHVARQERARASSPESALDGLLGGLTGLGLSLLSAVAGLADHPLRSVTNERAVVRSTRRSMLWQLLVELNRGVLGLLTKPLSGVAELIALTSQGILHSTGLQAVREFGFDAAYVHALFEQPCSTLAPRVTAVQFRLLLHADALHCGAGIDAPFRVLPTCRTMRAADRYDLLVSTRWLMLVRRQRQQRSALDELQADWSVQVLCTLERRNVHGFQYDPLAGLLTIPIPAQLHAQADALDQYDCCQRDTEGNRVICLLVHSDEMHNVTEFLAMLNVWP